jgi:hypothetical protein
MAGSGRNSPSRRHGSSALLRDNDRAVERSSVVIDSAQLPIPCGVGGKLGVVNVEDPQSTQLDRNRQWAAWALRCWSAFPANASPRPLVLSSTVHFAGRFASAEAQTAFRRGNVVGSGSAPETVLDVVRQSGDVNAFGPPARPLEISSAERVRAEFNTDRGPRQLDAWRLACAGFIGEMSVLDPEIAKTRWIDRRDLRPSKPFKGEPHLVFSAVGRPDSTQLDVSFIGGHIGSFEYDADVIETEQAIAVIPIVRRHAGGVDQPASLPRPRIVSTHGFTRQVRVTLARPLGGRVLVDLDASACVISAPEQAGYAPIIRL